VGAAINFPRIIFGMPVTLGGTTTTLLGGAELTGTEALAVGETTTVGDVVGVPPQAVNATSRRQTEIARSLLPRLNAVFFTAILLFVYIFSK
jgi:hypothetical protein